MKLPISKKSIFVAIVAILASVLGIGNYELLLNEPQQSTIEQQMQNEPLTLFDLNELKADEKCTYTFVVTADAILSKTVSLEKESNAIPCGCLAEPIEQQYYVRPVKVTVENYTGTESILEAIDVPISYDSIRWTYSQVWFVSKQNCKEEYISDQPKMK